MIQCGLDPRDIIQWNFNIKNTIILHENLHLKMVSAKWHTFCSRLYIDGLMQKRPKSSALAMELRLFWIKPSICLYIMRQMRICVKTRAIADNTTLVEIAHWSTFFKLIKRFKYLNFNSWSSQVAVECVQMELCNKDSFHQRVSPCKLNSLKTLPCCDSIISHQIAPKVYTCHNSTAIMSCAKLCSNHYIWIEMRAKKIHQIWILIRKC